jgi:TPR repeat protein
VDNLISVDANRPLSANQGRVLNEKIATITGYFEGDSTKWARPDSGAAIVDGTGDVSLASAKKGSLELFEGEQAYRRGCEYLYGTNGFGLRCEGIAKTLGLLFLKQSADMGHSDGQYRYGRCLGYGEGCAKDVTSGIEYLRQSAVQGNSWAEAEYGKCLLNDLRDGQTIRGIEDIPL